MASRRIEDQVAAILARPYHRVVERGDDGYFTSSVVEIPGVISEGETADEAFENLEDAFSGVVHVMIERGIPIPDPIELDRYSGRLQLRMPPSLHRRAAIRAHFEGVSLNRMLSDAVAMYVGLPPTNVEPVARAKPRATRRPAASAKPAKATHPKTPVSRSK